jgi:hypothetical protein
VESSFKLAVSKLVTLADKDNTATVRDALPELLLCAIQAMYAAEGRPEHSTGARLPSLLCSLK